MLTNQLQMDAVGNNIANINTTGYKKQRVEFAELMRQRVGHTGSPVLPDTDAIPEVGGGVRPTVISKDFAQGDLHHTGRQLDLAIAGGGFFGLQAPGGGEIQYTRAGQFSMTAQGELINPVGHKIPDIKVPEGTVEIVVDTNGTVKAIDGAGDSKEVGKIKLYRFGNNGGLMPIGGNMYRYTDAAGQREELAFGEIRQGYLEGSNVDVAEEMIKMIEAQRAYAMNSRTLRTADEMWGMANNIRK